MKSRALFCNPEIVKNNFKRFWWIVAIYVIGLFLISPLYILREDIELLAERSSMITFTDVFLRTGLFLAIFPVLISTLVFRYLQTSKSATLLHSMPYTRGDLYKSSVVSGFVMSIIPILLNTLALLIIQVFSRYGMFFEAGCVENYFIYSFFITAAIYAVSCMVGMVTGSSIAQIIFTYIINGLPIAAVAGISYLFYDVLFGFVINDNGMAITRVAKFIPMTHIVLTSDMKMFSIIAIDIVITVVALVAGYFIYKHRNIETAGDVISNKYVKPIFKYGVATCAAICGALYIKEIFNLNSINILIYLLFALIGYAIAEMLLRKSFKILDSYKGFIVFSLVIILAIVGVRVDIFGFEKRLPKLDDVEYAAVGNYYDMKIIETDMQKNISSGNLTRQYKVLREKDNIQKLINLHSKIIEKREESNNARNLIISYKMKNGSVMQREYKIDDSTMYQEEISALYNTVEYKNEAFEILRIDESKIKEVTVNSSFLSQNYTAYDDTDVSDYAGRLTEEQSKKLVSLIKETINEMPYSDIESRYINLFYIRIEIDNPRKLELTSYKAVRTINETHTTINFGVNKNMTKIIDFLKECGYNIDNYQPNEIRILKYSKGDESLQKIIKNKETINEFMQLKRELYERDFAEDEYYAIRIDNSGDYIIPLNDEKFIKFVKQ